MTRKSILKILIFQEIGLILLSGIWLFFRNFNSITGQGSFTLSELNPFKGSQINPESLFKALGISLSLILLSIIIALTYEPFKKALEEIDNLILNKFKPVDILPIAILSGLGEEIFFRGILQQEIGILWTSICFALLHLPGKSLWIYSLWALFASLYLGNIYEYTHNLVIVIVAHILNNLFALLLWQRYKSKILKNDKNN